MQVDYRVVLEDLENRRVELDAAIAAIRRLLPAVNVGPVSSGASHVTGSLTVTTLPEKIIGYIDQNPVRIFSPDEIAIGIVGDAKAVRGALSRMAREKRVKKLGRGRYASSKHVEGNLFRAARADKEGE